MVCWLHFFVMRSISELSSSLLQACWNGTVTIQCANMYYYYYFLLQLCRTKCKDPWDGFFQVFQFTLGWRHLITSFWELIPSSVPPATHDLIRNLPQDCREMSLPLLLLQYSLFLTYMLGCMEPWQVHQAIHQALPSASNPHDTHPLLLLSIISTSFHHKWIKDNSLQGSIISWWVNSQSRVKYHSTRLNGDLFFLAWYVPHICKLVVRLCLKFMEQLLLQISA